MKLYSYEHCPFCVRVRMILSLTGTPFEEIILLNDDEKTPIKLCGNKQVPILEIDGKIMIESLDIVEFINSKHNFLSKKRNKNIEIWIGDANNYLRELCYPRLIKIGLPEFATPSAVAYFKAKKEKSMGISFEHAFDRTPEFKAEAEHHLRLLSPLLTKLPSVKEKTFSMDDILLFPVLRLLSCVYGLKWDKHVQDYTKHVSTITRIPLHKAV